MQAEGRTTLAWCRGPRWLSPVWSVRMRFLPRREPEQGPSGQTIREFSIRLQISQSSLSLAVGGWQTAGFAAVAWAVLAGALVAYIVAPPTGPEAEPVAGRNGGRRRGRLKAARDDLVLERRYPELSVGTAEQRCTVRRPGRTGRDRPTRPMRLRHRAVAFPLLPAVQPSGPTSTAPPTPMPRTGWM